MYPSAAGLALAVADEFKIRPFRYWQSIIGEPGEVSPRILCALFIRH